MRNLFNYIDYSIRAITAIGLIPFGLLMLMLSIMGTATKTTENIVGSMSVLFLSGFLIVLIFISAIVPSKKIKNLPTPLNNIYIFRLPVYSFFIPSIYFILKMGL